ncbi:MAG: ABC transporter substrate-binding protein [bacterium]|nr:ABC transporter substrate-binding protein [bacterium]MDE0289955.1 ABC transporter substrate-binding protein [bacterium]MDE0437893.1 ABC transporter substrate-binding protein [bacterium]
MAASTLASCGSDEDDGVTTPPSVGEEVVQQTDGGTAAPGGSSSAGTGVPGVSDQSVIFGQSAAFSGPAQELGKGMRLGIEAAFDEVNQQGGVHDRELKLISHDDTYEPEAAIANTIRLIEEDRVFALIGEVGTPTSRSATPVASEADVPFIAPFTGAAFLRDPGWANIVNLRASYAQETEEMVARMTTDLGIERIAIMYQDDSFGRTGYQGALAALQRRGMEPVSVGLYPRNTTAVKTGLLDLQRGDPEGVIIVGAYDPVAELISWARHTGFDPVFITISFVGSNALARELGSYGEGVYVTQVVPFPTDESIPIVSSYLSALAAYAPDAEPGFVSLEGYLAGRLAIAGLERCGRDLNRACFLDGLLTTDSMELEGFPLSFGPDDNQGSDQVFLTVIGPDGGYIPTEVLLGPEDA